MTSRLVMPDEKGQRQSAGPSLVSGLPVGSVVLSGLAVVALADLVALWVPVRLGAVDWEFATVASTIDSLPLITLATGLLAAVAYGQGWRWRSRLLGIWFALAVAAVAAMGVLHALNLPVGMKAVPADSRFVLMKAGVKTLVLVGTYLVLYLWLAVVMIRRGFSAR
jgi:hypothetical protein